MEKITNRKQVLLIKIYLVSGKAQSGKDTSADIIQSLYEAKGNTVLRIAYADDVKHICKTYFNWNGEKDEKGRELLQTVGTNIVRECMGRTNYWVHRVRDIITMTQGLFDVVLITDCRFPNEIEEIKKVYDEAISIRIERPSYDNGLTVAQNFHSSEIALDDYKFDHKVVNDSDLESLENKLKEIIGE